MRTAFFPIGALTLMGVLWLGGCETDIRESDIKDIPLARVRALMADSAKDPKAVLLIDSRPEAEYAAEHIPGAMNLQLHDLNPDRPRLKRLLGYGDLVVYGENPGSASASGLTKRMMEQKYRPVRRYPGGLAEWKASGFETQASAGSTPAPAPQ